MTQAPQHPDPMDLAGFVDRRLDAASRDRMAAHLAECDRCRREVLEVMQLTRDAPIRSRAPLIAAGALAAAAAILLVAVPQARTAAAWRAHREPAVTSTVAPQAISPVGDIGVLDSLRWSSVPGADGYVVSVFDSSGTILWQSEAADTVVGLPGEVPIGVGRKSYWSVKARTGWGRWAESSLNAFTLLSRARGQ